MKKNGLNTSNNTGGRAPINGGTGGQDPNISIKSDTSISTTKTGVDDYLNDNIIEDVRVGNMLLNQHKINEYISNFFAMTTIIAGVLEYELSHRYEHSNVIEGIRDSLLWTSMICSFFLIFSIFTRYDLLMRWKRSTNQLTKYDNLINTGWYKSVALEVII